MSAMASQITSVSIVCWTVGSGADQRKHQKLCVTGFVCRIHWWLVNSQHKRPVTGKMFPFDDVIMSSMHLKSLGIISYPSLNLNISCCKIWVKFVLKCVTSNSNLWPWPFVWTLHLPKNIGKNVGQTDKWTEKCVHRDTPSQLKKNQDNVPCDINNKANFSRHSKTNSLRINYVNCIFIHKHLPKNKYYRHGTIERK